MSSKHLHFGRERKEAGMVAIMVTLILMIVISLLVLGFAQISRRNQRQTLDRQLSTQAFYAAESGVNEVANLMQKALREGKDIEPKTECQTGPSPYTDLQYTISDADGVEYTCLTVDPTPSMLEAEDVGETGMVFPLTAVSGSITSIKLSWKTPDLSSVNPDPLNSCPSSTTNSFKSTGDWIGSKCGYGVLRVDLVPTTGSLSMANLQSQAMTTFFVPLKSGGSSSVSYANNGGNNLVGARCTVTDGCTQTVTGLPGGNSYYVRVSSIYKKATSLQISVLGADNVPLKLRDAQAVVDVTGKAQDVLRRIQVRIPLHGSSTNLLSDYAIQSTESICKRFAVMDNYYENRANDAGVSGIGSNGNKLCQ